MDSKTARVIASQFYAAKNLKRNPAKTIKFIISNKDYFPGVNEKWLELVKKEHNLTDDDINNEKEVIFADINAEEIEEAEKKAKAKIIQCQRIKEKEKRDYGKGIKSYKETERETPNFVYDLSMEETNEQFAKLSVNLRDKEFITELRSSMTELHSSGTESEPSENQKI